MRRHYHLSDEDLTQTIVNSVKSMALPEAVNYIVDNESTLALALPLIYNEIPELRDAVAQEKARRQAQSSGSQGNQNPTQGTPINSNEWFGVNKKYWMYAGVGALAFMMFKK